MFLTKKKIEVHDEEIVIEYRLPHPKPQEEKFFCPKFYIQPNLVEASGFEPPTSCLQSRRSPAELRPQCPNPMGFPSLPQGLPPFEECTSRPLPR